jgi:hypothetical protein
MALGATAVTVLGATFALSKARAGQTHRRSACAIRGNTRRRGNGTAGCGAGGC